VSEHVATAPAEVSVSLQKVERQPATFGRISERLGQRGLPHTAATGSRYVDATLLVSGPSVSATSPAPFSVPWVEAAGRRYPLIEHAYTIEAHGVALVCEFEIPEETTSAVMYMSWSPPSARPLSFRLF
jgi:hypothetical protein